jgi:hypothetical protein
VAKTGQKRPLRTFRVARRFRPMVESICYKDSPYTLRTACKAPTIRKAMLRQMSRGIQRECKSLCSRQGQKFLLRCGSAEDIKKFKFTRLSRELQRRAPTLYHALKSACHRPQRRKRATSKYILPMAAAVLLRGRNQFLCLPQMVISTILYTGHC